MPFTHNGQEFSDEQIAEILTKHPELEKSYKKLEGEFTKTSQSKKEIETQAQEWKQFVDEWGPVAQTIVSNPALAKGMEELWTNFQNGTLTQKDANTLQTAIKTAQKSGEDDAVKELKEQLAEVKSALAEQEVQKTFDSLTKRAESDGLDDFTLDGFQEFASKWMEEELDIGDEDDVTPKEIRLAYTAYKAHLLEDKTKRDKVPNLKSDSAAPPTKSKGDDKVKDLKDAGKRARAFLGL